MYLSLLSLWILLSSWILSCTLHPLLWILSSSLTMDGTRWRRLSGCLKLQVTFRKRATSYRALLRKITYNDKLSYDSAPPCRRKHLLSSRRWRKFIMYMSDMRDEWYRVAKTRIMSIVADRFCKRATNYMALLREMTYQNKASYESAPPCTRKYAYVRHDVFSYREVGGWGRDPKKCTGRDWGMGASTI